MTTKEIIVYVSENSWFELEDNNEQELIFVTRENGNVDSEKYGKKDLYKARELKDHFNMCKHSCKIEIVNEWIYLNVQH